MEYEVIDNYLTDEEHQTICDEIVKNINFALYISNGVSYTNKDDGYYFTHHLYNNFTHTSDKFILIHPILNKLNPFSLTRIKVNFYPKTPKIVKHGWHTDYDIPHKGAIYYLNTNNGKTILEDGTEIDSVANRILLFDPSVKHRSTTCTDDSHGRYNINFNFM